MAGEDDVHVQHGRRKFYDLPSNQFSQGTVSKDIVAEKLFPYIEEQSVGANSRFLGPFGWRQLVYCDYTATGRALSFIEDYIRDEVLPFYGNTHTTSTVSSMQTTLYRHEARDIVRRVVNASEDDVVLFSGSGCTGAINKLVNALGFTEGAVAFIGPYEHHSNLLPWKEARFKIVWIGTDSRGAVDMQQLETNLEFYSSQNLQMIGCFSAASNITGILSDVDDIAACLHRHGALAFFDYATAGPYVDINMNPLVLGQNQGKSYKDAIFISPHKFPGGPGTPGVLVAKKKLFNSMAPSLPGGGGVFFVTHNSHRYLKDIETREESGTPDIIGSVRTGLVFQLKENVSFKSILKRDQLIVDQVRREFAEVDDTLIVLGASLLEQLPIFSFVVKHQDSGRLLHYNYVSVLLNDLFGIQARGGCACSGPYAQQLLGMSEALAMKIESVLLEDDRLDRHHLRRQMEGSSRETLRPGFTRLNLAYFASQETVQFVIDAVKVVAKLGWRLLPFYSFNAETGEWKHKDFKKFKDRKWLGSISYADGKMNYPKQKTPDDVMDYQTVLQEAEDLMNNKKLQKATNVPETDFLMFDSEVEKLRWFLLPSEAQAFLIGNATSGMKNVTMPFSPGRDCRFGSCSNGEVEKEQGGDYKLPKLANFSGNSETSVDVEDSLVVCKVAVSKKEKQVTASAAASFISPPKAVMKPLITAIDEFKMINDGDRILLCLSGGKDSLSMLHAIKQYQHIAKSKGVQFTIGAMTVDPQSPSYDPSPLIHYTAALGVPYFYEEQNIIKQAADLPVCESICSFCSRMKRGRIYACARREGYNVIALGQHIDDLAESFMMSAFHNGFLRTMKANYLVKEKDLRVIRPLVYAREKDLRKFAESTKLPVIAENCPACFEAPKERHRVKQLLAQQEILYPNIYKSLTAALKPLLSKNRTGLESCRSFEDDEEDDEI